MLRKADQAGVSVKREAIEKFGQTIALFEGVEDWFARTTAYGKKRAWQSSISSFHLVFGK